MNKKEMAKILAPKEQTQEEIGHMLNASKEINNLIQNDNINDKIEMFKQIMRNICIIPNMSRLKMKISWKKITLEMRKKNCGKNRYSA